MSSATLDPTAVRRWNRYPEYRAVPLDWPLNIPAHWHTHRLKEVAAVRPSNVDKKSVEGERAVQLCNYVDVYKHDRVTADMEFMAATATDSQIAQFSIRGGDVIITKDSETWDDIAVPAYVPHTIEGLVCGYHLALIRPDARCLDGAYLAGCFAAEGLADQFRVAANGITRYGLDTQSIKCAVFPVPPLAEQRAIAAFLDRETARIDALIGHKERLIALLEEKRQAVIGHAVTRGLDPEVPLKDSGVPWLGLVPRHWEVKKLKYSARFLNYRRIPLSAEERGGLEKVYPYYGASGIIDQVDQYLFDEPLILIGEDGANLLSRSTPLAFIASGKYWVNNHAHILKPKSGQLVYWTERLNSISYEPFVSGSAQPKLTSDALGSIEFAAPDASEQAKIAQYIEKQDARVTPVISRVRDGIARLQEYRTALISAAVTGQIDVRGEVNP
jgi:type I restriction enzyme S subunit